MPPRGQHRHHNSVEETSFALTLPLSSLFVVFCIFFSLLRRSGRRRRRRFLLLIVVNGARASSTLESGEAPLTLRTKEGKTIADIMEISENRPAGVGIGTLARVAFRISSRKKKTCLSHMHCKINIIKYYVKRSQKTSESEFSCCIFLMYSLEMVLSLYFSDLYFKLDHIPWSVPISVVSIFLDLNLQSERLIVMIEYTSARRNQWVCPFSRW